jgi:hypothetical protein
VIDVGIGSRIELRAPLPAGLRDLPGNYREFNPGERPTGSPGKRRLPLANGDSVAGRGDTQMWNEGGFVGPALGDVPGLDAEQQLGANGARVEPQVPGHGFDGHRSLVARDQKEPHLFSMSGVLSETVFGCACIQSKLFHTDRPTDRVTTLVTGLANIRIVCLAFTVHFSIPHA